MSECKNTRRDLPDFHSGRLGLEERRKVEEHLSQCAACQSESVSVEKALKSFEELLAMSVPESYFRNFLPRLNVRLSEKRTRKEKFAPWVYRFLIPSGGLVAVILLLTLSRIIPSSDESAVDLRQIVAQMNEEELRYAGRTSARILYAESVRGTETIASNEGDARRAVAAVLDVSIRDLNGELGSAVSFGSSSFAQVWMENLTEEEVEALFTRLEEVRSL